MIDTPVSTKERCECCTIGEKRIFHPFDMAKILMRSVREVMREKQLLYLFLPLSILLWFGFVTIPVFTIPSNTFAFQLSLYTTQDYVTLSLLAALGTLFFLTYIHSFKKARAKRRAGTAVFSGGVGGVGSFFASIFGAASCPMCVASLFGFLGLGTVGFLVNYQWMIFAVSTILVVISLYFVSRKVVYLTEHQHE